MKISLLLDANISWRSVAVLKEHFDDCRHADNIGLHVPAKDAEIWDYAKTQNMIIVTHDEDFMNFSLIKGYPPKVIIIKIGNLGRVKTEELLIASKKQIEEFFITAELGILEIIGRL